MNIWIQTAFCIVHSSQLLTLQMLPPKFAKGFIPTAGNFSIGKRSWQGTAIVLKWEWKRYYVVASYHAQKESPQRSQLWGLSPYPIQESGKMLCCCRATSCSATCRRDIKSHLLQQKLREILCNIALSIPPLYLQSKVFIVHLKNYWLLLSFYGIL